MKTTINLLPVSFRRQQMLRRRAIQWMVIMCMVFVGSWASHWYELREQTALSQQLEVLRRQHQPTQTMLRQLVEMRHRLSSLQQHEVVARELEYYRNALSLLGVISTTAEQTKGRLRVTKLQLSDFQVPNRAAQSGAADASASSVLLAGVSLDNPAVAEFLDRLQDCGLFERVELVAMKEREGGAVGLRDYEVRCEF